MPRTWIRYEAINPPPTDMERLARVQQHLQAAVLEGFITEQEAVALMGAALRILGETWKARGSRWKKR